MLHLNQLTGRCRFFLLDLLGGTRIRKVLSALREQQYYPREVLQKLSRKKLDHLFERAKTTTGFYQNAVSYASLPVLTKEVIRENFTAFISGTYRKKLFPKATSGSTGIPLSYLTTTLTRSYLWAGIILSWEVAGYRMGDKVAFVAGTALLKKNFRHEVFYKLLNIESYSAYTLNDANIEAYIQRLKKKRIKIIYGYASAMNKMANYILANQQAELPDLKGIICTAEVLTEAMKENISTAFRVPVYNQYGCNEAGVSAFECEHHHMHLINMRSYFEIGEMGNLLSTDLSNEGFILMKYDTGDRVELSEETTCPCKRGFPVIENVIGRVCDIVVDTKLKALHGAFFNILFRNDPSIQQFQILYNKEAINIYLNVNERIPDRSHYNKYLTEIKKHLCFKEYNLFLNSPFLKSENAKHRHVVNIAE